MTSAKSSAVAARHKSAKPESASLADLAVATASNQNNFIRCIQEISEISQTASQTLVKEAVEYGSDIQVNMAKIVTSKLSEPFQLPTFDKASPFIAEHGIESITQQWQQVLDAHTRLLDVASTSFGILSHMQSLILESIIKAQGRTEVDA
jgi:hypothetical protein